MRLLLFDYDGTLVNLAPTPDLAQPTKEVRRALESLHKMQNTDTFIITGRSYKDIKNIFGNLNLQIIAEHGSNMALSRECKSELLKIMSNASVECTGSFIEEKECALAWHYRNSSGGYSVSRKLIELSQTVIAKYNLKIIDGNKVVEVINREAGKGMAVRQLLDLKYYDFVLAIGDDITDESMFEELKNNLYAITVKVGKGKTAAKEIFSSPKEVTQLITKLSNDESD